MSIPEHLRAALDALPDRPGVYVFKGEADRELYVGKAKSLRKRVRQYFDEQRIDRKTADLVSRVRTLEFIECESEVEAYLLENRLIKDFQPPFNFYNKSDMNFPVVEITWGEAFPRVVVTRDRGDPKSTYYGPFVSVTWLRTALQVLQRVFKYRTCTLEIVEGDPKNLHYRPCLEYYIGRCKAPCADRQSAADYRADLRRLSQFLSGQAKDVRKDLEREMWEASKARRFEEAAALRDTLKALEKLGERGSLDDDVEPGVLHIDPKEGLAKLQELFALAQAPRTVEGIDIAHLQGTETVGSLVSFTDGLPSRERYRRFRIKSVEGVDDFASIREVVTRRYGRLAREGQPMPDIVLIDGGIGQLHAARDALHATGLRVPFLASLAKREELLHTLEHPEGLRLPRRSPALRLLQYVRDEAHRFAQHYHHILRRKKVIEGLGDEPA
ncbi:MAG: excinuclease ABC subunit UvrC [Planctomycetota bacterium]|nr:excinuclease ABC subunit UvrC [Planctomycetota bacterium]